MTLKVLESPSVAIFDKFYPNVRKTIILLGLKEVTVKCAKSWVILAAAVENWRLFLLGNVDNANDPMLEPLIAQIRDLFPELGEGFLAQCLAYFDNNTERVINALLEDNLPPHLANLDRALAKPSQPPANVDQNKGSLLKGTKIRI